MRRSGVGVRSIGFLVVLLPCLFVCLFLFGILFRDKGNSVCDVVFRRVGVVVWELVWESGVEGDFWKLLCIVGDG